MTMFEMFYSLTTQTFTPPKLQCHRGFWVEGLQQNSLAALTKAFELGYKMSEFDVRLTKDGQVILFHDDLLGERRISDLTLAELKSQQNIDTLESVLQWFSQIPQDQYYLNIEIKSKTFRDPVLEEKVLNLILKFKVQNRILVSSFNPLRLFFFRRRCPNIARALLLTYDTEKGNSWLLRSQILNVLAAPHFLNLHEKYWSVKRFKPLLKRGIPVVLWTCNDPLKVKNYFNQGVFGVISDSLKPQDL